MYYILHGKETGIPRPLSRRPGTDDPEKPELEADARLCARCQRLKIFRKIISRFEEGSLYPALQRMLKAGWLKTEMGLSARNRPVRIFKVTEAGSKHLEQELASVEKMFAGITRVLAVAESQEPLYALAESAVHASSSL